MTPQEFLNTIIRPALHILQAEGPSSETILLETAIQESRLRNIQQIDGSAEGPFQMEKATHDDIWQNFLGSKPLLASRVRATLTNGMQPVFENLLECPLYACAMARVDYERAPGAIPTTLACRAAYYKQYYNTPLGKATIDEYITNTREMLKEYPLDPNDPLASTYN